MPPHRATPTTDADPVARVRELLGAARGPAPRPDPVVDSGAGPPPGPARRRAVADTTAWTDVLRGRWSLPATAGLAAVVLVAAVAALLVLRAVTTAPAGATGPAVRSTASRASAGTGSTAAPAGTVGTARAAPPDVPPTAAPVPGSAPAPSGGTEVVVDVEGHVLTPGLVHLPAGSRVDDAVRAAGGPGPSADLTRANLARVLADGELLVVPAPGDPVSAVPAGGAATARAGSTAPAAPVSLSTATAGDLDALPGVGPVLAQRIVDWRTQHGPFTDVEQLGDVSGIGDKLLERLRPLVVV